MFRPAAPGNKNEFSGSNPRFKISENFLLLNQFNFFHDISRPDGI